MIDVINTNPPKAMILAAGLGTRLKPWTDHHPKALAVVNGKPLLQRNIEYLQQYGIKELVINVHHFADQVVRAVKDNNGWGSDIIISHETDEPLETGGGLLLAAELLKHGSAVVLMNVDVLTDMNLGEMLSYHFNHRPLATLATTSRNTSRYFLFDDKNKLCGWKNTLTGEQKSVGQLSGTEMPKAFSGIHIINTRMFSLLKHQGKFSIVDAYLQLMSQNDIISYDHSDNKFIDVGKPESILRAETLFR